MNKFKKPLLIFIAAIIGVVVLIIVFISPIAKYLIEKYDEKFTGRQIEIDWAYVNPFTGYVHLSNFKAYEYKSDSIFLSSNGVSANFEMFKLLSKTYEISEITLNKPRGSVIQDSTFFNFNDLIEKFSPKDTVVKIGSEPVHFNILNIRIKDGEFYFHERITPINYFITNVNISSEGKRWDNDSMNVQFSFDSGIGSGNIKGKATFYLDSASSYKIEAVANRFDLQIVGQYLKELTNYGRFSAFLDADVKAVGSFRDKEEISLKGLLAVTDLHFGKNIHEDYLSFDRLAVAIEDLSPKKHTYSFDSITLDHPCFKYERYDHLDNIQTIFGKKGANIQAAKSDDAHFNLVIEIARYVKVIAQNFFKSPYKIDHFRLSQGDITFNDFAISEKFTARLYPMYIHADSIDKHNKGGKLFFESGIKPYGDIDITIRVNSDSNDNFDVVSHLRKVPAALFNPYLITYTSFPLSRGTVEFNSTLNLKDGYLTSVNHLLVLDPRVTKRQKNNDFTWIPTPLIMAIVREYGNVIDYEIPITGNLKNPKFHFRDVLLDLVKNIFIKPVTTPYRLEVRSLETQIEKLLTIKWPMRSNALKPSQIRFIERMGDFLVDNPEAKLTIEPHNYTVKEKEYILFFEAKKKYYLAFHKHKNFEEEDSITVDRMSVKDSNFVHYLNLQIKDSLVFTIQEKCSKFVDSDYLNKKFEQLEKERQIAFQIFFKFKGVADRVTFLPPKDVIPYNGFSFYKIEYKGELPASLVEAYQKINDLNEEAPRKKFLDKRRKYRKLDIK